MCHESNVKLLRLENFDMKSKVKYQGVRYSMKHFEIAMLNDIVPMDT